MSFAHKIRVGVLRGGPSSEYAASLKTGETVLKNLSDKYEGVDIFISQDGVWHVSGFEKKPAEALKNIDVAFVALHGRYGREGKVQRILEQVGVPFVGTESFASAIAMNKHLAEKALARLRDKIKFAAHKLFSREEVVEKGTHAIFREISMPAIVRSTSVGRVSDGSVVRTYFDLEAALGRAIESSDSIIIEEFIPGRGAACGVVEGFRDQDRYASVPAEIISGGDEYACPSSFDEQTKEAIQEAAKLVHEELGLRHYSHSNFIIHPRRGIYLVDMDTLPSLTPRSPLSRSLESVGATLPQFLDHVLTLALGEK